MKLTLVVTTAGKSQGQVIPVKFAQFVIGRDPQCNLRPASALISKRHCSIIIKGNQVTVRDFDSTNGTFVNEQQIQGEVPIKNEDLLRVGPLTFTVKIEDTPSFSKPTPPPKAAGNADDEAAAAVLLALQEDGEDTTASGGGDASVPSGSTVFDVPHPTGASADPEATAVAESEKKPEAKKPDAKASAVSASKAAEALLAKYTRRGR